MVTAQDLLPDSLAKRLTDEQRQALAEAPRGGRLAVLVSALACTSARPGAQQGVPLGVA